MMVVVMFSGQTVTFCGTDRGVVPIAPVAPSTHHHDSMYDYPVPQPITSRSGSVVMEFNMKMLRYNSWNSM